ncbi:transposase [Nocardia sp. NPDC051570]|uniref:transposase n=1 Tax=Nocardia sp. NPDC051570 TaxID=3364324 RepID=UPI00378D04E8
MLGSTRRSFTEEYRAQAVAFVLGEGRPVAEVARNIGVHEMTLRKWVRKARESGGSDDPADEGSTDSERVELARLRAENAELKMQVAFAKKVATWFAKDQR